jgi:integrase
VSSGAPTPTTRQTVERYAAEWLPAYSGRTASGLTERSRAAYSMLLDKYALPWFGPKRKMAEVDRRLAREYVAYLDKQGLSPASIKKAIVPLAAMFATAVDDGDLTGNPFANLRINARHAGERSEEERAKAMTRAELGRFLAAVPEHHRPLFTLLSENGIAHL